MLDSKTQSQFGIELGQRGWWVTNTSKAIRDHIDDEGKLTERIVLSG